jgi:hypothetical protein
MSDKETKSEEAKQEAQTAPAFKMKEYKPEDLAKVLDELIFSGEYTEEVTIKNKLKVSFRTRTAEETMHVSRMLDSQDFKLLTTMQEQRAYNNLLRSLTSYQGKDLSKMEMEEKGKFIRRLPTSIIAVLSDSLAEFDRKVDLAAREEANF